MSASAARCVTCKSAPPGFLFRASGCWKGGSGKKRTIMDQAKIAIVELIHYPIVNVYLDCTAGLV